jgi:hypothetical protein
MTDDIHPEDHLSSALSEVHQLRRKGRQKRPLGTGALLTTAILVGLTGGIVGAVVGLTLGEIVGVNYYLPASQATGARWYEMRETIGALTGFVVGGLLWASIVTWILARK